MNTEKNYQCLCGQEFTTPNKFNAHKRNCEIHLRNKYGDRYEDFIAEWCRKCEASSSGKIAHAKAVAKREAELARWVSEQHTCEKCGVLMTQKFGPGRFCSRKCSNSRKFTEETNQKKREAAKLYTQEHPEALSRKYLLDAQKMRLEYDKNPNSCKICGKNIPYNFRYRGSCSSECLQKLRSQQAKDNIAVGGYREGSGIGKHGYYKGYKCDSTYELAYVIYNLDHGIEFERFTDYYLYIAEDDSIHKYYPDFIQDGYVIEIKGYMNENVYRKISVVSDYPVKLLRYPEIKPMIDYVQNRYNIKDISELYD